MDALTREQLASQAVAMIAAHFSRPNSHQTIEILQAAIRQTESLTSGQARENL
jgi:hypothetical protein